jgi:hypothetical protein
MLYDQLIHACICIVSVHLTQVAGCSAVIRTVVERSVALREDVGRVPAGSEECVELNWKRVQLMFVINSMLSLIVSTVSEKNILTFMYDGTSP